MKLYHLIALTLLPMATFAQPGEYRINGKIGTLSAPAKVYLTYRVGKTVTTDSTLIKRGVFEFRGKVADPVKARLIVDRQGVGILNLKEYDFLNIYLENAQITVSSPDSISRAKVSGSSINDENKRLTDLIAPIVTKQKALAAEYTAASKAKNEAAKAEIEKRYDATDNELNELQTQFIRTNPGSFVSLDAVKSVAGIAPEVETIEPLFNGLSGQIKNTTSGKEFALKIEKLKKVAVGATAPDFTQANADNKPVKLSDFKGKYLLVDFWASWCGPCRRENPNVVEAHNRFKDKNFTILGVSLDKDKEAWLKAVEKDQLNWTQVSDTKGWDNEVAQLYAVQSIPANFLIDPNGKIIARNLRENQLLDKLAEILK